MGLSVDSDPLDPAELSLLNGTRVAHLATIAARGEPHLVPVCFALVGGLFFVPIDEKPKRGGTLARVRDIQRDPRATLLFDHYDEDWTQLAWLRFDCEARLIESGHQRPDALSALRGRYLQYREMALEQRPLIELTPFRRSGWRWATATTSDRPGRSTTPEP
ncbi:MAG: TIGR03668 family PPOX class F420-dependent oxidoreductase [Tepidiformaceae bacterium]